MGNAENHEIKFFHRGKFGPYALIGFKTKAPLLHCSHKPFVMKESTKTGNAEN